jgi:hypothetical protein
VSKHITPSVPSSTAPWTDEKLKNEIRSVIDDLHDAIHRLHEVARRCVAIIENHPKGRGVLVEMLGGASLVNRLEMFGRGQIDERLVLARGSAVEALSHYPLSVQQELLNRGVYIYREGATNESECPLIPPLALSTAEVKQALAGDAPRDIAAQKQWLEERRDSPRPGYRTPDAIAVHRGRISTAGPVDLSFGQFARMVGTKVLAEMISEISES